MKHVRLIALLLTVVFLLCACGAGEKGNAGTETTDGNSSEQTGDMGNSKSNDDGEEAIAYEGAITIYYVTNRGMSGLDSILGEAKKAVEERFDDRITLDAVVIDSYDELYNKVINEGMPDLVYVDEFALGTAFDPFDLADKGVAVPFTPYVSEGNADEYFQGVIEAGMVNGELIMFPVSVSTNYLMTSKNIWQENGVLNTLGEKYTLNDLMEAIELDVELHDNDLYWPVAPLALFQAARGQMEVSFLQETGILTVNHDDNTWYADVENMKMGIDYLKAFNDSYDKMMKDDAVKSENLDVLYDRFLFVAGNWNIPYVGRYFESAYAQFTEQELMMTYYPSVDPSSGYGVTVNEYVLLGGSEESRAVACQVADILAHIKVETWVNANYGDFINLMTSPVKSVFAEEVDALENNSGRVFKFPTSGKTFNREALSEEMGESMIGWSGSIDHATVLDTRVLNVFEDTFRNYIRGEEEDFESCYQKFSEGMNGLFR